MSAEEQITEPASVPEPDPAAEPEAVVSESAFIVYLDANGHWTADTDTTKRLMISRPANMFDIYNAAATVQKDITVSETAQTTVMLQQQSAAAIAQRMQAQQMAQQAGIDGAGGLDLSHLKR